MSEPMRKSQGNAPEHIPYGQEKDGPKERRKKLNAHEMSERDFKKPQHYKRWMVQAVEKLRQENHMEGILLDIGQVLLDAMNHE